MPPHFHSLLFLLGFGSLSHPTNVRQPAASPIWERAGGEGRQGRLLGSVAHAHTSTELSMSGGLDSEETPRLFILDSTFDIPTFRWLHSYFDEAQHERRAGFGGGRKFFFGTHTPSSPCHREESSTKRSRGFLGSHRAPCWPQDRHVGAMTVLRRSVAPLMLSFVEA